MRSVNELEEYVSGSAIDANRLVAYKTNTVDPLALNKEYCIAYQVALAAYIHGALKLDNKQELALEIYKAYDQLIRLEYQDPLIINRSLDFLSKQGLVNEQTRKHQANAMGKKFTALEKEWKKRYELIISSYSIDENSDIENISIDNLRLLIEYNQHRDFLKRCTEAKSINGFKQ